MVTPARARRSARGVALLDAIIAAILLGLALTALVSVASGSLSASRLGQEIGTAAMLADEQLQLVLARGPDQYARKYPVKGRCEAPFEAYAFELTLTGGGATPYRVKSSVKWDSSRGPQTVEVETLIAARQVEGDAQADPDRRPVSGVTR